jgi:hypothetical protein
MTRSAMLAALTTLGVLALSIAPAVAQAPTTVIVPAPSGSPSTVVVPAPGGGTTVIAPPGSTVTVQPPPSTAVVPVTPWCAGAYSATGGTNFGGCPAR